MRIRQILQTAYLNVALLCVLIVGLEVVGQVAFYLWKGYPVFRTPPSPEQGVVEQHPYLVGRPRGNVRVVDRGKVVTTTPWHTRWTGAPDNPEAIRVAVVGGSTTFGAGVTDTASWPAHLQGMLGPKYAVLNFGMLGYSTAEGVIQMGLVVPEFHPDIVVFYEGWNDIRSYHDSTPSPEYYSHGMRQYSTLSITPPQQPSLFARLADVSAIFRFAVVAAKGKAKPPMARQATHDLVFATPDTFVDRIYRRNLETLKLLSARTGAYTFFVPQVLNDAFYNEHSGGNWWTPHVDDRAMPALIRRLGGMMNETCTDHDRQCAVVNEVRDRHWQPYDFIDEGHFSGKGGEAFARIVAARIGAYAESHHVRHQMREEATADYPAGAKARTASIVSASPARLSGR